MPPSILNFLARLVTSPVFIVLFLILGTTLTGYGAGLLAANAGVTIGLVITSVVAFVATHFAFGSRSLEMHLFTGVSILAALMLTHSSTWWVALPGAVAGLMGSIALVTAMDAPNQRVAEEEAKRKKAARPNDEG